MRENCSMQLNTNLKFNIFCVFSGEGDYNNIQINTSLCLNIHICLSAKENKKQCTGSAVQPKHVGIPTMSHLVPSGRPTSKPIRQTVINRWLLVRCFVMERGQSLFECVMWPRLSAGQGVGCEIVGILGYCRLGPPNRLLLPPAALLSLWAVLKEASLPS